MKQARQDEIIRLINSEVIENQSELMTRLSEQGYSATQATISRDIRQLGLKKVTYGEGKRRYASAGVQIPVDNTGSYSQVLQNCIMSLEAAENIIVVKTVPGMAMAVGAALDKLDITDIVGCIAGDDTLFVAVRHSGQAERIIGEIKDVAKYAY